MNNKIDLLLIKVNSKKKQYSSFSSALSAIEPPLWAVLMAAYVRERGFTVKILDAEAENLSIEETAQKINEISPLLSGIIVSGSNLSASTQSMPGINLLTSELKKAKNNKIFIWGLHPSALPEKTLREENVDFVFQGEGLTTCVELLEKIKENLSTNDFKIEGLWYLKDNIVYSNPRPALIINLDELPIPAWDLLPMEKYRAHNWHCFGDLSNRSPYAVIYTSLGCPYDCYFCALKALFGKPKIRYRSPIKVIEEIDLLVKKYKISNIKILDECFILNERHVTEICDLIIANGYKLNIWAYARIDTINENMLNKMKKAGINWLGFGIESGSKKIRDIVKKRNFEQDLVTKIIKMVHDAGIHIGANFMFGLPEDNMETMQETLDMAKELNCEYTNFYVTMAYPGSKLYDDSIINNVQLPETWLGYAQFSEETYPLPTNYLKPEQVLSFRDKAFEEYHGSSKYLNMIKEKFGIETFNHITEMLKLKIKRKYI